jgi:hypothetical protein
MVNVEQITNLVKSKFLITGHIHVDDKTGVVNVQGSVAAREDSLDEIPVQFGQVTGDFNLRRQPRINSLVGSPRHVGRMYKIKSDQLTTLNGAPEFVGYHCWISGQNLSDLAHLPIQGARSFTILWAPKLPLLRLLDAHEVSWGNYVGYGAQTQAVREIMNKYVGKGKSFILNCANELKQVGFVENARW